LRKLVVTADDVGLHPGMTEGVLRAHRDGIVTACSVSANGRFVDDAAARLHRHPALATGIHFTLVGEAPVAPRERVRSLLGSDGRLLPKWPALVRRHALRRLDLDEVEIELRAQIDRLRSLSLRPVHANGHQHLHVLPGIFERVVRVAADEGIGFLRVPREPAAHASGGRGLGLAALEACGRRARRRLALERRRFVVPDSTPGLAVAGRLDTAGLLALLRTVEGLAEIVVHPGVDRAAISRDYDWGYLWDDETAALCSPAARDALPALGIELVSMPPNGGGA
jgi:predicted glycoside hydrolase/deacetylase ChbG (UPF0249 family)